MNFSYEQLQTTIPANNESSLLGDFRRLPLIIRMVLLFMIVIFAWNRPFFGFNMSGLAWVIPLSFSLLLLTLNLNKVTFPYLLCLPWALLLFAYLFLVDGSQLHPRVIPQQRTMQLLSPLAVGMAVSVWRPTPEDLMAFMATCRRLAYIIMFVVLLKTGVISTGALPVATALAPEAIGVTLLCTLLITNHICTGSKHDFFIWMMLVLIPIIALTRMAIAASLMTFPLSLAPLPMVRRIIAVLLIAVAGVMIFNIERVQRKMFYSGQGSFKDVGKDDFATSGRSYMWEKMILEIKEEKWAGYGLGTGETFIYRITGNTGYPHNDWLLTLFDHGILGLATFMLSSLLLAGNALSRARHCPDDIKVLFIAGAAAYIPFCMMMSSDNIMVYSSFFGNLHFIILGVAYGALKARQEESLFEQG